MTKPDIGFTSGCFDLLHVGHLTYLQRCRDRCSVLVVGVDSDEMVRGAKGPSRPVIPQHERLALIKALPFVGHTTLISSYADLTRAVHEFGVTRVFKHQGFAGIDHVYGVDDTDAELVIVPDVPGLVSTSEIIDRIRGGNPG